MEKLTPPVQLFTIKFHSSATEEKMLPTSMAVLPYIGVRFANLKRKINKTFDFFQNF
jgi:hypothetical protein